MPVPKEITDTNLSGKYVFDTNLAICDEKAFRNLFRPLGIPQEVADHFFEGVTTIRFEHRREPSGVELFQFEEILGNGMASMKGARVLNGKEVESDDPLLGPVISKTSRIGLNNITGNDYKFWTGGTTEPEGQKEGLVEDIIWSNTAKSGKTWKMHAIFRVEDTSLGRRLAWIGKTSGPKAAEEAYAVAYMDYVGPL